MMKQKIRLLIKEQIALPQFACIIKANLFGRVHWNFVTYFYLFFKLIIMTSNKDSFRLFYHKYVSCWIERNSYEYFSVNLWNDGLVVLRSSCRQTIYSMLFTSVDFFLKSSFFYGFNPFNLTCHLQDDIQNAKEISLDWEDLFDSSLSVLNRII